MDDDRACWVLLCTVGGIGPIRFQKLLQACGDARSAWRASELDLAAAGLDRRTIDEIKRLRRTTTPKQALEQMHRLGITPILLTDPGYPENLRQVADPPPVLFSRGAILPCDGQAVALVGTRRATAYGRAVTERLATDLAHRGITVVSGLAKGIDTVAHFAAVRAGGRTIAVLGNGLDQVYPPENTSLAATIVSAQQGAVVSEFAPGIPPDAVNFPRRNRIISGLSRMTVIVEAGERSGALITADFALEQGRDVLSVPGSIHSAESAGANALLKQGATPVTCVDDILLALGTAALEDSLARARPVLAPSEATVWQVLDDQPRHVNELVLCLPMPVGTVSAALAMLELKGFARQAGPMLYTRA